MIRLCRALSVLVLAWPAVVAGQDPFAELEQETQQVPGSSAAVTDGGFAAFKQQRLAGFESYKDKVQREFAEFAKLHNQVAEAYEERLSKVWAVPEQSTKTRWVLYEDDYQKKSVVDFEAGTVTLSTPEQLASESESGVTAPEARETLSELMDITQREAFERDEVAHEVEEQSRRQFELLETAELSDDAVLPGYLFGEATVGEEEKQRAVEAMAAKGVKSVTESGGQTVVSWTFPLTDGAPETHSQPASGAEPESTPEKEVVAESAPEEGAVKSGSVWSITTIQPHQINRLPAPARSFVASINRENREFELSAELLLAIMETESAFNPMAKSPIPAFGLMQIVPVSAGQDATAKLFGKARILAPSYLYNAENNIKVGSAYFNILYYRYFRGVEDPLTRLYCAVAAYNTGPGNVSKALTGNSMALKPAARVANSMTPQEVYGHLLANLPYKETVNYLRKVTARIAKYEGLLTDG